MLRLTALFLSLSLPLTCQSCYFLGGGEGREGRRDALRWSNRAEHSATQLRTDQGAAGADGTGYRPCTVSAHTHHPSHHRQPQVSKFHRKLSAEQHCHRGSHGHRHKTHDTDRLARQVDGYTDTQTQTQTQTKTKTKTKTHTHAHTGQACRLVCCLADPLPMARAAAGAPDLSLGNRRQPQQSAGRASRPVRACEVAGDMPGRAKTAEGRRRVTT